MKSNKLLYFTWAFFAVILAGILPLYRHGPTSFHGIAETREILLNREKAVEVRKIYVVPGQTVRKGDLLVELFRPNLAIEINKLTHDLEALEVGRAANIVQLKSRINALKALKASKESEINYEIKQLQARYDLNKELAGELKSIENLNTKNRKSQARNPVVLQIESLKKSLELATNPLRIKIEQMEKELAATHDPARIQMASREKTLNLLLEEKNKLHIFSPVTGIIASVNFKCGETVSPFSPIVSVHSRSPSYAKGFIHEKVHNRAHINQEVSVVSMVNNRNMATGKIVGVGSRIVEYPQRLRKNLDIQLWGREVTIRLPEDNRFLLGEKVLISSADKEEPGYKSLIKKFLGLNVTLAANTDSPAADARQVSDLRNIRFNEATNNSHHIEASGAIYLSDLRKYLIVSDSTRGDKPYLYLMDDGGNIEEELTVKGLDRIKDMEAITMDENGMIYIACSQDRSKKGNMPDSRKFLARIKRNTTVLTLDATIYLHDLLDDTASKNKNAPWAKLLTSGDHGLDVNIEGVFLDRGSLYLGLKKPLVDGQAVILRIREIARVFDEKMIQPGNVEIWKTFDLKYEDSGVSPGISDLYRQGSVLYILSYAGVKTADGKKRRGDLWKYDIQKDSLSLVMPFENLKPEGIAANPHDREFLITFDNGKKRPSQIMTLKCPE